MNNVTTGKDCFEVLFFILSTELLGLNCKAVVQARLWLQLGSPISVLLSSIPSNLSLVQVVQFSGNRQCLMVPNRIQ
jgi:hypothetical protein